MVCEVDMVLGDTIKIERIRNKLKQEELAKKIGVSVGSISFWEQEKTSPTMRHMAKLKKILGLNVDKILEEMIEEESEVADEVENIY